MFCPQNRTGLEVVIIADLAAWFLSILVQKWPIEVQMGKIRD
jgi:hypothetical protein